MTPANPFGYSKSLEDSIANITSYTSRWGSLIMDPIYARTRVGSFSAGLLIFHPQASDRDRRRVNAALMFTSPMAKLYGPVFIIFPLMVLALLLSPTDFPILATSIAAGLLIWGALALITSYNATPLWHHSALWWPQTITTHGAEPEFDAVLSELHALDSSYANEGSETEYLHHWQNLYDHVAHIRSRRPR